MRAEAIATSDSWELRNSLVIHGRCREDLHWPSRKDDYTSYDDVFVRGRGGAMAPTAGGANIIIHCASSLREKTLRKDGCSRF